MKTKNQLKAFLGLGALSLLTATLGGATTGCVADRPSRNGVFDENQYIRKDFLVRAGDATNPDYGWMLKATITDASEPNVFGDANVYQLFAGAHSDGELVHFVITSDNMTMVDNRQISSDPSVGVLPETVNAWPITNVDLKYQIDLDGEKTNFYQENQELDWQVRQWVKVNLDKNNMADLAPLGSYVTANVAKCGAGEGTATLVPNSFIVDEVHDYMEWTVQVTIPINWADATCVESYGPMGVAAQKLDRQFETVNLKYSMMRATPAPTYQPLVIDEKDPILHKYSPFMFYTWNVDPDTGLIASNQLVERHDPAKDQRWYFEKGFPDQYKNVFTSTNLPAGVSPLPAGVPTIQDATNQILVQANQLNSLAKGRVSFHEYNEPLDDGTPIERAFGDVRFNMIRWVESLEQQTMYVGNTGFVTDPRTGETISSDIVLFNSAIKDTYVDRIDAYLQSIGASPGLYTTDAAWPSSPAGPPDANGNPTSLPVACSVGQTAPLLSATVVANHNGLSTLFAKMQGYLYQPASSYGALGPQNFIVAQDADFLHAYYTYLPYIIYGDPTLNPYVIPESGATNTSPASEMWSMLGAEAQFHATAGAIDQGQSPFNLTSASGSTNPQDALDFLNSYKAMSTNHRSLKYAKQALGYRIAANNGGNNNNAADAVTNFSMESVMAKDARRCVTTTVNTTPHWETKQEWIDSLVSTYWSQVMWHEFGHAQGLTHNFMGSVDGNNFPVQTDATGKPVLDANGNPHYKLYSSSVMEYNSQPDRVFWGAGWAPYDMGALAWIYANNGSTTTLSPAPTSISGQATSTSPWNDPNGFQADKKTEIQYLLCDERHTKYTPLCRADDLGITPSAISANDIDNYEWQYQWRNFRQYHKLWDDTNYADEPLDFVTEARRFLSLWTYDMSPSELTAKFTQIGITPPPDAPSAQQYYAALADKFNNEMSGAASLMAAFHEAIVQQSSGQRPYVTVFDNYFGDVTQQGIILDKLDAVQSWLSLWPVDNYDQNQAAGQYIASYTNFGLISQPNGPGIGSLYQTVAEGATQSMLGGTYAAFAYFGPLGDAQFTQDTHTVNYIDETQSTQRDDVKDWTGGWLFTRTADFLSFFADIAVQNGFVVPRDGINCTSLATCNYDPRTVRAFASDTFYSDTTNRFVGPDGKRYIWVYLPSRNQYVVCDQDRHVATYTILYNYTLDVIQSYDDGNTPGQAYPDEIKVEYFIDYFNQFQTQTP